MAAFEEYPLKYARQALEDFRKWGDGFEIRKYNYT